MVDDLSTSVCCAYLSGFDLNAMEWRVFAMIELAPATCAGEIGRVCGIDELPVFRAVRKLVRRGMIKAAVDPRDGRRRLLSLTPVGVDLHRRVILASSAREEMLLSGLASEERDTLFALLERLFMSNHPFNGREDGPSKARNGTLATGACGS